eukprot:scaffold3515_cov330-Pinguiococcus_pyrenoidosus.AAC.1
MISEFKATPVSSYAVDSGPAERSPVENRACRSYTLVAASGLPASPPVVNGQSVGVGAAAWQTSRSYFPMQVAEEKGRGFFPMQVAEEKGRGLHGSCRDYPPWQNYTSQPFPMANH